PIAPKSAGYIRLFLWGLSCFWEKAMRPSCPDLGGTSHESLIKPCRARSCLYPVNRVAVEPHRPGDVTNRTTRSRRHSAFWRCGQCAQAIGQAKDTWAAGCCPQQRLCSDIDCIRERSARRPPRYSCHHDRQLLNHDMANRVAGSMYKAFG